MDSEMRTSDGMSLSLYFLPVGRSDSFVDLSRDPDPYPFKSTGKYVQLPPKAHSFVFAGRLLPSRFKSVRLFPPPNPSPFSDLSTRLKWHRTTVYLRQHDWVVHRPDTDDVWCFVGGYCTRLLLCGSPTSSLGVWPALESVAATQACANRWKGTGVMP